MSTVTQPITVARSGVSSLFRDYSELLKARVTTLIMMTAWSGYYFGALKSGVPSLSWTLLHAVLGIGMVSAGTAAMNEIMERDTDALMRRTAIRPLVTHSLSIVHALIVSLGLILGGATYLGLVCNWLTSALTLMTTLAYLLAYTPLKKIHPLCTFVGAFLVQCRSCSAGPPFADVSIGKPSFYSASSSSGSFLTSIPSRCSIAKTTNAQASACCPSSNTMDAPRLAPSSSMAEHCYPSPSLRR
jgi:hypothetical protein